MRLKITLKNITSGVLTYNYYYLLSAAIYKLLRLSSPEFSSFLHDIGYKLNGKSYKLFTFALRFESFKAKNSYINLLSKKAYLYISAPLIDEFIQNFIQGTFEYRTIELATKETKNIFEITLIETLQEAEFSDEMYFRLLSPVILSTKKEEMGILRQYYLRYHDDDRELNRIFSRNLKNKYRILTGSDADGKEISFQWDFEYIKNKLVKGKRMTMKQTIKEGRPDQTEVIGNLIPFKVKGDTDLIKTGYECGFGSMNSLGFGYAEPAVKK